MKRRTFIKLSSLATLPLGFGYCTFSSGKHNFDIQIQSDMLTGHLIWEAQKFPEGETQNVDVVVVGAGIAGLSAASQLKNVNCVVCELSDRIGGTSSAENYLGQYFTQGAHYDLAYPNYYGNDVLKLFKDLGIVEFNPYSNMWEFVDKQYVISERREIKTYQNKEFRNEVLPDTELTEQFVNLLHPYTGKMKMPVRLIDSDMHHLNDISFYDFLNQNLKLEMPFTDVVDYQMRDDYGANSWDISALAGIHYYSCRPYYDKFVELFSPPDGNHYFVEKLYRNIDEGSVLKQHIVQKIMEEKDGVTVEVIDVPNKVVKTFKAKAVVYAGQKHALKFIHMRSFKHFEKNRYAPWMVMNFVLNQTSDKNAFWQNDFPGATDSFMGFVDSSAQFSEYGNNRILTAYFCLPENARTELMDIDDNLKRYVNVALKQINMFIGQRMEKYIEKAFVKVMGHAMPIPYPGYLLNDFNDITSSKKIFFAGVDNGRLPLLFEAVDSGIYAASLLRKKILET